MPAHGTSLDARPPPGGPGCAPARRRRAWSPIAAALALAAGAAAATGCGNDEVKHFRVPKEAPSPSAMAGMGMPGMPGMPGGAPGAGGGMSGDVPPPPTPGGGAALQWSLPKGWSEERGGQAMRFATLKPNVPGKVDASVVVLPGPAGGELANVNRWRGQIGLAPLDDAGLGSARQVVKAKAGAISLYDFTSDGAKKTRTVAGFTVAEGNTWFVKLTGDAEAVAAARPAFLQLLESLRFDASR